MKSIVALMVSVGVVGAAALARSPQPQERLMFQNATKNPLPPEVAKALNAQANRLLRMEKQARLLLKQHRFAEAEATAHSIFTRSMVWNGHTDQRAALQLLGDISFEQGHYQQAIGRYTRAARHLGNFKRDCYLALCYVHLGDLANARRFYSQEKRFGGLPPALKAEYFSQLPGNKDLKGFEAQVYFALAVDEDSHASNEEAAGYYRKSLRLFPRNGLFAYQLAEKLMRLKRYDEALPMWARAARFGKGENAKDALNRMGGFPAAQREKAMRDAAKL